MNTSTIHADLAKISRYAIARTECDDLIYALARQISDPETRREEAENCCLSNLTPNEAGAWVLYAEVAGIMAKHPAQPTTPFDSELVNRQRVALDAAGEANARLIGQLVLARQEVDQLRRDLEIERKVTDRFERGLGRKAADQ